MANLLYDQWMTQLMTKRRLSDDQRKITPPVYCGSALIPILKPNRS
ncbi:hypothetical protein [Leptolyngbya sp. ST-U4]